MSNTFFTSDTHFSHKHILDFQGKTRLGDTVEAMDELLVEMWNSMVSNGDTVYHMGDVGLCNTQRLLDLLRRLNGDIILVAGNHDNKFATERRGSNDVTKALRARFKHIYPSYHEATVNGQMIVMCHFPIIEWNRCHRGSWHLHGHVHGKDVGLGEFKALDVGIDNSTDMRLFSFDHVAEIMSTRAIRKHLVGAD